MQEHITCSSPGTAKRSNNAPDFNSNTPYRNGPQNRVKQVQTYGLLKVRFFLFYKDSCFTLHFFVRDSDLIFSNFFHLLYLKRDNQVIHFFEPNLESAVIFMV